MATLELKHIVKRYQRETVLDNVSFNVPEGETLVLFGPSGAGKTVLLRLIAGVVFPEEGQVLIDGDDMAMVEAEDRGVGMAFQNFALFPHMSAFDNIASPLTAHRQSKAQIKEGVEAVARLLKIDHVLEHAPRALSNGQKQRTALARALVGSPPILLLDDPLRNVDAKLRFEMRLELPRLLARQNATVIYVTQDYKEAMALGNRIAVMNAGKIEQLGSPEDIYLTPANIEIASLFGDPTINLLDAEPVNVNATPHITLSTTDIALGHCPAQAVNKACVIGIRPEALRLVDSTTQGAIPVDVAAETPLNEKIVTLVRTLGGRELLVSRPAGTAGPTNTTSGRVHVAFDAASVMLFDRATGQRLTNKVNQEVAA